MFLEAGSQREVLISWLLELIVQVTVLWRGKRRREGWRGEEEGREEGEGRSEGRKREGRIRGGT